MARWLSERLGMHLWLGERPNRQVPGGDVRDAGGRFVDAINSSGDAGEDSVCIPGEKKTKVAASK